LRHHPNDRKADILTTNYLLGIHSAILLRVCFVPKSRRPSKDKKDFRLPNSYELGQKVGGAFDNKGAVGGEFTV
jgi:hypothetical protein